MEPRRGGNNRHTADRRAARNAVFERERQCGVGRHKLLCMSEKSQIDEMIPVLEAKHLPMTLVRSKDEYLEVVPAGAGKDTAMRALCEALGLTPAEVIALGDHDIDAPAAPRCRIGHCSGQRFSDRTGSR